MHVALVARALGADRVIFCGEKDDELLQRVASVTKKWGGKFKAEYSSSYRTLLKKFKGAKVHLTMYGMPLEKTAKTIKKHRSVLVVVGSEKVPADVYQLCDYNVSVTSQPHSEIAALALLLREVCGANIYEKKFPQAKIRIFPSEKAKNVKSLK